MHSTEEEIRLRSAKFAAVVSYNRDRDSQPLPTRGQRTEYGRENADDAKPIVAIACICQAGGGPVYYTVQRYCFPLVYWPMQVRLQSSNQPIVLLYSPKQQAWKRSA